jgi:hypothetical protein
MKMKKLFTSIWFCVGLGALSYGQPNLVPNPGFEIANPGKFPQCPTHYSTWPGGNFPWQANHACDFDDDIADWTGTQKTNINAGCTNINRASPDWLDIIYCLSIQDGVIIHNPTSNRRVKFGEYGDADEGIRCSIDEKFCADQEYTMRMRIASERPGEVLNKLEIYAAKWGNDWNSNNNNNEKQYLTEFNIDINLPFIDGNTFYSQQAYFTIDANKSDMQNLILMIAEDGNGVQLDDIELYKRGCQDDWLIENRVYDFLEFPFESDEKIISGFSVDPAQIDGNVVVDQNADVVYRAGKEVVLKPGFEAKANSDFHAYIAPCGVDCPFPIVADAGPDQEVFNCNGAIIGTPGDPNLSYEWTSDPPGFYSTDPMPTVFPNSQTTTYFLTVYGYGGCFSTDQVVVVASEVQLNIDISTGTVAYGVPDGIGLVDPEWKLFKDPFVSYPTGAPTYNVPPFAGNVNWVTSANSNWLHVFDVVSFITPGAYFFEKEFFIDDVNNYTTIEMRIDEYASDMRMWVYLNENPVDFLDQQSVNTPGLAFSLPNELSSNYESLHSPVSITSGFVTGINKLQVRVQNCDFVRADLCPLGFLITGEVVSDCSGVKSNTSTSSEGKNKPEKVDWEISIHPNPTTGTFSLELSGSSENTSVEILNYQGQRIQYFNQVDELLQLNLTSEPNGIYLIRIQTKEEVLTKRLIKQ